ncbi:ATP-dependent protease La domain-containing protein [Stachybotrys elegans]|uniref:ATP-dependent protease La domain-containing protein n=1 Tax=Stachybotrys elegans TaxID=80388 RepID=A0A8K0WVN3_9HYPO|nr:ATP-dependent protease La domain-containing protein [Stachybotrys elegans]
MSPEAPVEAAARPLAGPEESPAINETDDSPYPHPHLTPSQIKERARQILRLFQCPACSGPLRDPVTLPCGGSICRHCIPKTHVRANITYPAFPDRQHGFHCPMPSCDKEHALSDCSVDVILNNATEHMVEELKLAMREATDRDYAIHIAIQDPWQVAGISSLKEESFSRTVPGGRLVATWQLIQDGHLGFDVDVSYSDPPAKTTSEDRDLWETDHLHKVQDAARQDMDCQICYALFCDPLTTECGHTFCRSCLHRILDHSRYCPVCRRRLSINPMLDRASYPSNERLTNIIETFWLDELQGRKEAVVAEEAERYREFNLPLFVCTLSFPLMPTFLHIFEPRYRLMIRRALDGDGTFGMVLPRSSYGHGENHFYELGTLLRIVNVQPFSDGRSLIETKGVSRFRILRHSTLDGYLVGKTERIDDVSLEEEEALEASEVIPEQDISQVGPSHPEAVPVVTLPETVEGLQVMSTKNLMGIATSFVEKMRVQSAPWLTERVLEMCPEDPAVFPWWFASMLPVKDQEKYRLLATSSVRERLKICCTWIMEWETNRWSIQDCVIL